MKGKAPVDPECKSKVGKVTVCFSRSRKLFCLLLRLIKVFFPLQAHVYCEGSDVYDVMLNQVKSFIFNQYNYFFVCGLS